MRSRLHENSMKIEVEDDGVGIPESRLTDSRLPDSRQSASGSAAKPKIGVAADPTRKGNGIGMRNVRERLEVLYGDAARFDVMSRPGRGTKVTLEIPVMLNENGDPVLARTQPATRATTSS
jgi:two-component system LytT family sensor kinase